MQDIIDDKLKAFEERYGVALEEVPKLRDGLKAISSNVVNSKQDAFAEQVNEAVSQYDADEVNQYADFIRLNMGVDEDNLPIPGREPLFNPATGQPHTVLSLFEMVTGKTVDKARLVRSEENLIIQEKQRAAAGTPTSPAPSPTDKSLSETEAISEVRNLGFGTG